MTDVCNKTEKKFLARLPTLSHTVTIRDKYICPITNPDALQLNVGLVAANKDVQCWFIN